MISALELAQMRMRLNRNAQPDVAPAKDGVSREKDLHDEIEQYCKEQGWIALHGSTAHRTHRTKGEPDFTIFADGGRKIAIECKSRTGKLSTAQLGLIAWAKKLGHTVHVVRSMAEFMDAVKPQPVNTRPLHPPQDDMQ